MKAEEENILTMFDQLADGSLSADEAAKLDGMLAENPKFRRIYLECAHLHSCLHTQSIELIDTDAIIPRPAPTSRNKSNIGKVAIHWIGACLALTIISLLILKSNHAGQSTLAAPIAKLTKSSDCAWKSSTLPTAEGSSLQPGILHLVTGFASIDFKSGAKVTLEAPSSLELIDAMNCRLPTGSMVVTAPPQAKGFTVETLTAKIVDLGTEFGVMASGQNPTKVQVFDGEVETLQYSTNLTKKLTRGQGAIIGKRAFNVVDHQIIDNRSHSEELPDFSPDTVRISTQHGKGRDISINGIGKPQHWSHLLLLKNPIAKTQSPHKALLSFDIQSFTNQKVKRGRLNLQVLPSGIGYRSFVPDSTFAVYGLLAESLDNWQASDLTGSPGPIRLPTGGNSETEQLTLLGHFEVPREKVSGVVNLENEKLVDFINQDTNGVVTLVIVRETKETHKGGMLHGFSRGNHFEGIPPTLLMEFEK